MSIYGRVKNNPKVQVPAGKDGVDQTLEQLFSYGTKSLDRLAFQKALDDIGANESAGASFSLQVLPENFEHGVELLADNELSPALPEDDIQDHPAPARRQRRRRTAKPRPHRRACAEHRAFPQVGSCHARDHAGDGENGRAGRREKLLRRRVPSGHDHDCRHRKYSPESAAAVIGKYFGEWKAAGEKPGNAVPARSRRTPFRHARSRRKPRSGQGHAGGDVDADADEP